MIYKKILLAFLLFSFAAPNLFAQDGRIVLSRLEGEWEATYQTGDYKNKETMINKWVHNDKFFQMDILGNMVDNPEEKFSSTIILTFDDNDNIVGWDFDEGGYSRIVTFKGKTTAGNLVLEGTNPDFTYNVTFDMKYGKLANKRELKRKGKESSPFEVVFTKKK